AIYIRHRLSLGGRPKSIRTSAMAKGAIMPGWMGMSLWLCGASCPPARTEKPTGITWPHRMIPNRDETNLYRAGGAAANLGRPYRVREIPGCGATGEATLVPC